MARPLLLLVAAALLHAQAGLDVPRIGLFTDSQGRLRTLLGVGGSFLAGEALAGEVEGAACSGRFAVVKTRSRVLALNHQGRELASAVASPGPALASFRPSGEPEAAWLPSERRWLVYGDAGWTELDWDWQGEVVGLGWRQAVIRRDEALWLARFAWPGGAVLGQEVLAGVSEPLLLEPDGALLFARGANLVLRNPAGHEREVPMPAEIRAIGRLGAGWVEVTAGRRRLALRINCLDRSYELPEGRP